MSESQFEGFGAFIHQVMQPPVEDEPPYTHTYQPAPIEPADDAPVPDESWTWDDWQRYTAVMVIRDMETSTDRMLLGAGMPAMSWQEADDLYGLVQARAAEEAARQYAEATRRYWSGPSKLDRQILRAYRMTAAQLGLTPRSAFSGSYRQRQRNRRRR